MLFQSLDYFAFLGLSLAVWWLLRGSATAAGAWRTPARLAFLFGASCVFYMAWNPWYIGLILASTVLDYFVGLGLGRTENERGRRALLATSLVGNLGLLGLFKYFNFAGRATRDVAALFGVTLDPPVLDVLLPVGISFYTFQTLSYTIDVYRRRLPPTSNPLKFAAYVTFFPQLVAGPIVRAAEFLPQLERPPNVDRERVSQALFLIAMGLVKKVIFADFVSVNLVDRVFDDPAAFTSAEVVVGLYGFTLQIYADFSGYTDVARGSGMLFGFDLPENFRRPYRATSVAEFWRRWHLTLSTWLRDYLYFPLGGSKHGAWRTYFNLWLTIFLIGLWHGASWTFVIYGNLQAFAVMSNRALLRFRRAHGWKGTDGLGLTVLKIALTMQFVVFSRIFFRATSLDNAVAVFEQLGVGSTSLANVGPDVWRVLLVGFYLHYLPTGALDWLEKAFVRRPAAVQGALLAAVGVLLSLFLTQEVVPYIYFQF
jgi:alginate O-acetyltransferase complex protein AlgI